MPALGPNIPCSAARRAVRWVAPLAGVALLGVFSAQALGQSAGPKQISVPSLPTTALPTTTTTTVPLPPPPPLPTTTTTTVSTPVATAPVPVPATPPAPVPATPPAPVPKPSAPAAPSAPATSSAPAGGGVSASGTASDSPSGPDSPSASGSVTARDGTAASGGRAGDGKKARTEPRRSGLRAKPAEFEPGSKGVRRGTILVFRLNRPARLLITIYGPGPSCDRLGTFGRRGRAGFNQVPVSGSLFGRPLAPGRYAIVVEAVRDGRRVRIGRVVVTVLARDGREGGSRPLAAPECNASGTTIAFLASGGGDFGDLASAGSADGSATAVSSDSEPGGVAGVSADRGGGDDDLPLLPELPALPALPTLPAGDALSVPWWWMPALGLLVALGAAALAVTAFRRHRENTWSGWN